MGPSRLVFNKLKEKEKNYDKYEETLLAINTRTNNVSTNGSNYVTT